jgi:hypothetical protein
VAPVREWLTRKQKETRRGRAELRLAERTALWNEKRETRQLPSWWEWADIRLHTDGRRWTAAQRTMMSLSGRRYGLWAVGLIASMALAIWAANDYHGRQKARELQTQLSSAETADVPGIVNEMDLYRSWLDPMLRASLAEAQSSRDDKRQLRLSLALLPSDAGQAKYLHERLLRADAQDFKTIRGALASHPELIESLWSTALNPEKGPEVRFRAACALAEYAYRDPRWDRIRDETAAKLVSENPLVLGYWTNVLKPVGVKLLPQLEAMLKADEPGGSKRRTIAKLYQSFAESSQTALGELESNLTATGALAATPEGKVASERERANIAAGLMAMGRGQKVWPLLVHSPDPTLRSFLIERLSDSSEPAYLEARLRVEPDVSARRALILILSGLNPDQLSAAERDRLAPKLLLLYRDDPDPGIHAATEWTLRRWRYSHSLRRIDAELATKAAPTSQNWFVNSLGQTMMIVLAMKNDAGGPASRRFAIGSKEVTVEDFLKFRASHEYSKVHSPSPDCPINTVTWFEAAAFCNWLSERDGINPKQWCYLPNADGSMSIAPNFLELQGYRLPTEAEWEWACRAGALTTCSFGDPDNELVMNYARFQKNSYERPSFCSSPAGKYKPNDWGLFDMNGNAYEWCHDNESDKNTMKIFGDTERVCRGGSFYHVDLASDTRLTTAAGHAKESKGFRVVRLFK